MNARLTGGLVLEKRRYQEGRPFKHQPFSSIDHAVDDAAFEQLAAGADDVPTKTGEPAAIMQVRRNRSTSAPSCTSRYTCMLFEPGNASPVSARLRPALVDRRVIRPAVASAGTTDTSAGQCAEFLGSGPHRGRHALGVDVE